MVEKIKTDADRLLLLTPFTQFWINSSISF